MPVRRYKKASKRIARRGQVRSFLNLFLKIGLPVALLVGLVFLLRANFLQVKAFEVVGSETVASESIKGVAASFVAGNQFLLLPKSNLLLLNKTQLATTLLAKFSRLAKVDINENYLNKTVELKVTERQADFLWCSGTAECFFMTKEGLIFEPSNSIQPGQIIFRGLLTGNPLMQNFATPAKIQNYSEFAEVFKEAGFEVSAINIESDDRAVAKTKIGDVIFSPDQVDLAHTAEDVILLINNVRAKKPAAQFNYIDARFDNKFFYKLI